MNKTLMIVDDSRLSRNMIKAFVTATKPDWNIIEAESGEQALTNSEGLAVDIVTIDYNMPGMDGITLAAHLKAEFPQAKMALLTANIQDSVKQLAESMNIMFIRKPITQAKIKSFIEG
ncbi:MAG: response regulator [Enterobacterales bacterium]|nr:response regulator [Enterobacterales bacterium]